MCVYVVCVCVCVVCVCLCVLVSVVCVCVCVCVVWCVCVWVWCVCMMCGVCVCVVCVCVWVCVCVCLWCVCVCMCVCGERKWYTINCSSVWMCCKCPHSKCVYCAQKNIFCTCSQSNQALSFQRLPPSLQWLNYRDSCGYSQQLYMRTFFCQDLSRNPHPQAPSVRKPT